MIRTEHRMIVGPSDDTLEARGGAIVAGAGDGSLPAVRPVAGRIGGRGPSPLRAAYGPWRVARELIKRIAFRGLVAVAMLQAVALGQYPPAPPVEPMAAQRVVRVVDGDTVVLNRGGHHVTCRLIGVNTPETVAPGRPVQPGGPEASSYLRGWIEGKTVRVSYEKPGGSRDRYGRLLVYLWADEGRQMINYTLIERGFGRYERGYPTKYRPFFDAAERKAQADGLGIWAHSSSVAS
jgi:micrococcal nuclease